MLSVTIRCATEADAEALLEIYAPYVTNTAVSFEYTVPTVAEFRERIRRQLENYPYLVAETEQRIVGYAYANRFHGRAAYKHAVETSIYVSRELRGQGIGKALYSELERWLLRQEVFILYACIVYTDRADDPYLTRDSIRFHEHMGYQAVAKQAQCGYKFDQWYGILWMEKLLAERPAHPRPFIPFSALRETSSVL